MVASPRGGVDDRLLEQEASKWDTANSKPSFLSESILTSKRCFRRVIHP
ncbi:MAG: hypothetical protein ACJAS1_001721 [Oleiphilaceae bacterium]|jgi:hypothetical protein